MKIGLERQKTLMIWPSATGARSISTGAPAAMARTLLANSRLGVVMVGELPSHALEAAFKPLRDEILAGTWSNRHLLVLPLSGGSTVATLSISMLCSLGGEGPGLAKGGACRKLRRPKAASGRHLACDAEGGDQGAPKAPPSQNER